MTIQPGSQLAFGGGKLAGNPRISLTSNIYRLGERLEKGFHNMMRLIPVQQFQMQVAAGFIGKTLKKLARQPESAGAGHVLSLFTLAD